MKERLPTPQRCETTLTMRYPVACQCGSIGSGIGPCVHWEPGANPERCVYCDHIQACHHKAAAWLEESVAQSETAALDAFVASQQEPGDDLRNAAAKVAAQSGTPLSAGVECKPVAWMIAMDEEGIDHAQAITISKEVADVWGRAYKIVPLYSTPPSAKEQRERRLLERARVWWKTWKVEFESDPSWVALTDEIDDVLRPPDSGATSRSASTRGARS